MQNIKQKMHNNELLSEEELKVFIYPVSNSIMQNIENILENIIEERVSISKDFLNRFLNEWKYSKFNCFYLINIYTRMIKKIENDSSNKHKDIENQLKKTDEKISKYYLTYEKLFNLNFGFNIKLEKPRSNSLDKSYKLVIKDSENKDWFNYLSTGERRKLSLIIFLSELEYELKNNNEKEVVLIFDDPIDSSDFFTYLSFKNIVIKKIMLTNLKIKNVIILTHNIDYIFSQLINTEKDKINDIHLFKIQKTNSIEREILEINYKQQLLNDNQILLKCFHYLYENIKLGEDIYDENKVIFFIYCFYSLITRRIELQALDEYFSVNSKKLVTKNDSKVLETLRNELTNDGNFIKVEHLCNALRNCKLNNEIWRDLLKIYKILISSFLSKEEEIKIEEMEKINMEHIVNLEKFTNTNIKEIVQNFKVDDHIESVIKLIGIVNVFKNDFQKNSISNDLAAFIRHSNNNIFKPLIALEDVFSYLEINS